VLTASTWICGPECSERNRRQTRTFFPASRPGGRDVSGFDRDELRHRGAEKLQLKKLRAPTLSDCQDLGEQVSLSRLTELSVCAKHAGRSVKRTRLRLPHSRVASRGV
jgi:hypothetical protein